MRPLGPSPVNVSGQTTAPGDPPTKETAGRTAAGGLECRQPEMNLEFVHVG